MPAGPNGAGSATLHAVGAGDDARVLAVPPHQRGFLGCHAEQAPKERIGQAVAVLVEGQDDLGDGVIQDGADSVQSAVECRSGGADNPRLVLKGEHHTVAGGPGQFLAHECGEFGVRAGVVLFQP
ncbi:Uncharacterised protein [Mycobacteroides abscessus subsp. abscessus]|nr:Uncharacterised protein [Mycobacteroides abscessus subsp. abscessus]